MHRKKRVKAVTPPPSLLELWRCALVAQHTAWQNKYMPDVDDINRFVHQPPQLWVEQNGGAYEPTEMERGLWEARDDAAGEPEMMMQLATKIEQRLSEAVSTTNPRSAPEDGTLVQKLEALSGSGWAILND